MAYRKQSAPRPLTLAGLAGTVFVALYYLFEAAAKAGTVLEGWKLLEKSFPILAALPAWTTHAAAAVLALLGSAMAVDRFARWRRRQLALPTVRQPVLDFYAGDDDLRFRFARDSKDIADLARTEDYGSRGVTDVAQATAWWGANHFGNVLATYKEKVIGGIEFWPITRDAFEDLRLGKLAGEHLPASSVLADGQRSPMRRGSYWYAASVSLDKVWTKGNRRGEILLRLIVAALEAWLRRDPPFPAHIVTEAWTPQGRNLLVRSFGFTASRKAEGASVEDEVYTLTLPDRASAQQLIERLKSRLAAPFAPPVT